MSIIRFAFSHAMSDKPHLQKIESHTVWEEGAHCPLDSSNSAPARERNGYALVIWHTHVGLCLADREVNGYSDSDFYMTVWNPELGKAEQICFASTRGWSYPSMGSFVDATEEVQALYQAWNEQNKLDRIRAQRRSDAELLIAMKSRISKLAKRHGVAYHRLLILLHRTPSERQYADRVEKLLTSQLRSPFRIGLRTQLIEWLRNPTPKHPSPFSHRQWEYV